MKRTTTILAIVAAIAAFDGIEAGDPAPSAAIGPVACGQEDGPGWNWRKCGNRDRGVWVRGIGAAIHHADGRLTRHPAGPRFKGYPGRPLPIVRAEVR